MAIFKDPLRSLTFEFPAGFAYDLLYSTMTDFFFARWDRLEEMLVVHLRRAAVPVDSSDEAWVGAIRKEVGDRAPLFDMDAGNGRAVAADFVSGQGMTQRVAFLRGAHVDIAVEQRNADMDSPAPWEALASAIQTAESGANTPQDGDTSPTEFNRTIEAANSAFEKKDYAAVSQALQEAIRIGTSAWLASLTSPDGSPEINAAVRVAQAMVHLGRFTGRTLYVRDAASILRRALCSLESAGKASSEEAQGLVAELKEILDDIQSELMPESESDSDAARDSSPIISIRERGFRSAQAAAKAFDAADYESSCDYAGAAVEDFLFLLVYFRRGRAQQIPDEILKHLVDQGISDHEEQRDAIQKTREGMLFPAMNLALQLRYCCAMEKKEFTTAIESANLYLPLARQVVDFYPGDTGISLNLALALLDNAGAIAALQDAEQLEKGMEFLDEALGIIEATDAKECRDDGWIRNYAPQVEKALEAINVWKAAVQGSGEDSFESELEGLYSKFEKAVEDLRSKIEQSPDTPE